MTGFLAGPLTVLTAGHLIDAVEATEGPFDAVAIVVIPGLDGRGRTATPAATDTMPFGWVRGADFRASEIFRKVLA